MSFAIRHLGRGLHAVAHLESGEVMHPMAGPWREANELYVRATDLERLLRLRDAAPLTVFDVGLGAAANALAALATREALCGAGTPTRPLHIVSFEQDLAALAMAIDEAEALVYPLPYLTQLEALLEDGRWATKGVTWELRHGDFTRLIGEEPARAEVVFYDPFSPATNPAMWSVPVFEALYGCRRPGADLCLATYSAAYSTRAALLLAGFFVGEGPRGVRGRHSTVAAVLYGSIHEPLTGAWLRRWQHDADPWPRQSRQHDRRRLREVLQAHAQWLQPGSDAAASAAGQRRGKRRSAVHGRMRPNANAGKPAILDRPRAGAPKAGRRRGGPRKKPHRTE